MAEVLDSGVQEHFTLQSSSSDDGASQRATQAYLFNDARATLVRQAEGLGSEGARREPTSLRRGAPRSDKSRTASSLSD